jgi:hypothetical protein
MFNAKKSLDRIEYGRLAASRLICQSAYAVQLMENNFILFWLICGHLTKGKLSFNSAKDLFRMKQPKIIKTLFGADCIATVNFLRKMQPSECDAFEFDSIMNILKNNALIIAYRHYEEICIQPITYMLMDEDFCKCQVVYHLLKRKSSIEKLKEAYNLFMSIIMLSDELAYQCASDINSLKKYYHSLVDNMHHLEYYKDMSIEFCSPPLPGTEHILPILFSDELYHEGRRMENCCFENEKRVGEFNYFYKVLAPRRATLQIRDDGKGFKIADIRLEKNKIPDNEMIECINRWLEKENGNAHQ